MGSGRFDQRVTIQRDTPLTTLSTGENEARWVDLYQAVPADVETLSGSELVNAAQTQGIYTHRVTMRYRDGIVAGTDRILWGQKTLNIVFPSESKKRRRELVLMCIERSPQV